MSKPIDDCTNEPIYWFAILESAQNRGELETAAHAQRELARLGVRVRYGRPARPAPAERKGPDHAR